MSHRLTFKQSHTLGERLEEAYKLLDIYPNRIPIIIERHGARTNTRIPESLGQKLVVSEDVTFGQFAMEFRNKIKLRSDETLFFFVGGNTIPSMMSTMRKLYEDHKEADKFMYVTYSEESVYGGGTTDGRITVLLKKSGQYGEPEQFLVNPSLTIGEFQSAIRHRIQLRPHDSLHLFIEQTIPSPMLTMAEAYQRWSNPANNNKEKTISIEYREESVYGEEETFKRTYDYEERRAEAERLLKKYPGGIPLIVEKSSHSKLPQLAKKKFLVPPDLMVGQFLAEIRERIQLRPEQAVFFFVNKTIPATMSRMREVYAMHHEEDLFLYLSYCEESVYGAAAEEEK